jgi:hypothetical protein
MILSYVSPIFWLAAILVASSSTGLEMSALNYQSINTVPGFMIVNDWNVQVQDYDGTTQHDGILNDMMDFNNQIHRILSRRELSELNPVAVCESYNNATKGMLECECQQYTTEAVLVKCSYIAPQCNLNATFCFDGYIETMMEAGTDGNVVYNVTTSCSNITTSPTPEFVCIRIFPNESGNFTTIGSCSATYNNETCNSCSSCEPNPETMANASLINNTHIAINCCNVVADKKQTCGSISENGATVQQFDPIEEGKEGQCTESSSLGAASLFWTSSVSIILISMLAIV